MFKIIEPFMSSGIGFIENVFVDTIVLAVPDIIY
tara:strand:+ start:767 stop:868 length:102 start_codon:yes stop_codon:yes gene_type:complete